MRRFLGDGGLLLLQGAPVAGVLALHTPVWLPYACGFGVAINLWAWLAALKKRSAIQDTPTSRIASAAQGYVELIGVGCPLEGMPVLTPHTQLPCLWYRYLVERRRDNKWQQIDRGESEISFALDDGSGLCEIDPRGAEIFSNHVETRTEGEYRHSETVLLAGDSLYVLGRFTSIGPGMGGPEQSRQVGELLGEWKQTPDQLHARFDTNRDGRIDQAEWRQAQRAAEQEIASRSLTPPRHVLTAPGHGKPHLISNRPPEHLGRRYAWLAGLHLALLLAMLAGLGWSLEPS